MEENKIESGNKIVSEFMGGKEIHQNEWLIESIDKINRFHSKEMRYNSSWDWQIPVYSKLAKRMYDINRPYLLAMHNSYIQAITENNPLQGFEIIIENLNWLNKIK